MIKNKKNTDHQSLREKELVKRNLRILMENSHHSGFQTKKRIMHYGASSFRRNIWLSVAATLVMTITLIILLSTVIASAILSATADTLHNKIDIVVYFKPNTSEEILNHMKNTMQTDKNTKEVTVNTSQQEYNAFIEEHKDNKELMATFDDNMSKLMLDSMQSTMHIKVYDPNNLDSIKEIINTNEEFLNNRDTTKAPSYDTDSTQIETINNWANIAKNGGLVLSVIFIAVSILVIFNTIRMAIFSRREEIYMMKLVGADNHFIRGPFLIEAQISGILSGIIASTIGLVIFNVISPKLANYGITVNSIKPVFDSPLILLLYLIMIVIGIIIGTISARLAIRKYLH